MVAMAHLEGIIDTDSEFGTVISYYGVDIIEYSFNLKRGGEYSKNTRKIIVKKTIESLLFAYSNGFEHNTLDYNCCFILRLDNLEKDNKDNEDKEDDKEDVADPDISEDNKENTEDGNTVAFDCQINIIGYGDDLRQARIRLYGDNQNNEEDRRREKVSKYGNDLEQLGTILFALFTMLPIRLPCVPKLKGRYGSLGNFLNRLIQSGKMPNYVTNEMKGMLYISDYCVE